MIKGDYGFLDLGGRGVSHVCLLGGPPRLTGTKGMSFYAHSNNRCGQFVSEKAGNYSVSKCVFYRIGQARLTRDAASARVRLRVCL